MKGIWTPLLHI